MARSDAYNLRARELAAASGLDPDACRPGEGPAWLAFRHAAKMEAQADE